MLSVAMSAEKKTALTPQRIGRSLLPSLLAAAAALLSGDPIAAAAEGTAAPLMAVTVNASGPDERSVEVPVSFTAPLETRDLAEGVSHYLVARNGSIHACQVEPLGRAPAKLGYRWANLQAALAPADETYILLVARESVRPDVPLAGAALLPGDEVALGTGAVQVLLKKWRFSVFDSVKVSDRQIIPAYVPNLINPQQGLKMIVTDTFRHADFTLTPRLLGDGFRLLERGPVRASAVYEGVFEGEYIEDIPFTATVGLLCTDVIEVKVDVAGGAFDDEVYDLKSVVITLPLVLETAARLSFGGEGHNVEGAKRWEGGAALEVAADGSYAFGETDGPQINGRGPLAWAHYGSDEGGAGFIWEAGSPPVSVEVLDYEQDLLAVSFSPVKLDDGAWQARLYILFDDGSRSRGRLDALARAIENPPQATVDPRYVKTITKAR